MLMALLFVENLTLLLLRFLHFFTLLACLMYDSRVTFAGLARHLLNHHVRPLLYLTSQTLPTLSAEGFAQYKLYKNSGGTMVESPSAFPKTAIDLIVDAIGPAGKCLPSFSIFFFYFIFFSLSPGSVLFFSSLHV